jgi:hypothetical protein
MPRATFAHPRHALGLLVALSAPALAQETATDAAPPTRVEIDLNKDLMTDVVNFVRDRGGVKVIVRKEVDLNFDGRFDVFSDFDDQGRLLVEKMDLDFDGKPDQTDYYKDGVRVRSEIDSDFDGAADIWSFYIGDATGKMRIDRKERDTNKDGRVDLWERFDDNGNVVRTGRDTDNDGKLDERDE